MQGPNFVSGQPGVEFSANRSQEQKVIIWVIRLQGLIVTALRMRSKNALAAFVMRVNFPVKGGQEISRNSLCPYRQQRPMRTEYCHDL